jgi:hypothetical protein
VRTFPLAVVASLLTCGAARWALSAWRVGDMFEISLGPVVSVLLLIVWLVMAARGMLRALATVGVVLAPLAIELLIRTWVAGRDPDALRGLTAAAALRTSLSDSSAVLLMAAAVGSSFLARGSVNGRRRHFMAASGVALMGALTLVLQGTAAHDEWRALHAAGMASLDVAERWRDQALGALLFDTKLIGVGIALTLQAMVVVGLWLGAVPPERQPGRQSALAVMATLLLWSGASWGARWAAQPAHDQLAALAASRPTLVPAESTPCDWPMNEPNRWVVPSAMTTDALRAAFAAHGAGIVTLVGARVGRPLDKVPASIRPAFWARPQLAHASLTLHAGACHDCISIEVIGDVLQAGPNRLPLTWATLPSEAPTGRARVPPGLTPSQVVQVASTLEAARLEPVWELPAQ